MHMASLIHTIGADGLRAFTASTRVLTPGPCLVRLDTAGAGHCPGINPAQLVQRVLQIASACQWHDRHRYRYRSGGADHADFAAPYT